MSYLDPVAFTADADIWCPDCAAEKYGPDKQTPPYRLDDEGNEVHAVFSGSDEADTPQHCAGCGAFLENDLTPDGARYVADADPAGPHTREWQDFYGIAGGWSAAPRVESPFDSDKLQTHAWPGGYPLFYRVGDDNSPICVECAQKVADSPGEYSPDQFRFRSAEVNWEDTALECDNCYDRIPCAYNDPDDEHPHPDSPRPDPRTGGTPE